MITIFDLLNKIKWDKKENPKDYKIIYFDRIENKEKELKFTNIKEIGKEFLTVITNEKEIQLPLHRIKKVYKKNTCIWKR